MTAVHAKTRRRSTAYGSTDQRLNRLGAFLRGLRVSCLIPLSEVAALMRRWPSSVAKLETQADCAWTMFSLQKYAAALGGRVRVTIVTGEGAEREEFACELAPPPDNWRSKWASR
jgi:hypothetical protein